jgi:nickel/cobalt exporter
MRKGIFVMFILLLLFQTLTFAQDNPFTADKPKKGVRYPSFLNKFVRYISSLQRELNQKITELSKEIKEKRSPGPIFMILFITFVYGMIHALGPGHGKTITFSYFLAERAEIKRGILVGVVIGFLHAASALILVLVLYFIVRHAFMPQFEGYGRIIRLISYGCITIIGLFLLVKAVVSIWKRPQAIKSDVDNEGAATKSIIPFAIAVGVTPCTGAVIVLLFSISMGILHLGIVSTLFMALGMATTISIVGILAIAAKKSLTRFFFHGTRVSAILQSVLSVGGAVLIIVLGLLLFMSTL